MMVSTKIMVVSVMMVMVMMMMALRPSEGAITCGQVVNSLTPCLSYVQNGGAVPPRCCAGIKSLYGAAKTTPDRQGVCRCLKSVINGIPYNGNNVGLAAGLPNKCGVKIPYKINPSTDCNSIK